MFMRVRAVCRNAGGRRKGGTARGVDEACPTGAVPDEAGFVVATPGLGLPPSRDKLGA
jgi:hypothetical protein